MTDREAFLAMLYNGPLLPSDAVAILSGDGVVRIDAALGVLRQAAAHYAVALGGLDNPPHSFLARDIRRKLIDGGLHPERIIVDDASQNTRDQAVALAALCAKHDWKRVLLSASAYHMPRAFLTVLKALQEVGLDDVVQVLPLPAWAPWIECPDGLDVTRITLFGDELRKVEKYGEHVASYADGLKYLRWLEGERTA